MDSSKYFLLFGIIMLMCLSASESNSVATSNAHSCMMNHLKSQKMLNKNFRHISNDLNSDVTVCQNKIKQFQELFYEEIENRFKDDEDFSDNIECMMERMKDLKLAEISMKKQIYENTKVMSKRKHDRAMKYVDKELEKKIEVAVKLCLSGKIFGELFDELLEEGAKNETDSNESSGENSLQEEYCVRKYVIDSNVIDTTLYKVKDNPKHIDTTGVDCSQLVDAAIVKIYDDLEEEFESETDMSKKTSDCISEVAKKEKYFEIIVKAVILGELHLSKESKNLERTSFVEAMKSIYGNIIDCK